MPGAKSEDNRYETCTVFQPHKTTAGTAIALLFKNFIARHC